MLRALTEFRVRGVKTNIPFMQKLLLHPLFVSGDVHTCIIDEDKTLFQMPIGRNRAQKTLVGSLHRLHVHNSTFPAQPTYLLLHHVF